MKKLICLFTLLLTILLLTGCSLNGYRYVEDGENSYISIDSLEAEEPDNSMGSGSVMAPAVYFSSVDEMKSDIKQGRFTEEELKEIAQFKRNSDGKILAPSIENLRNVTLPDRLKLDRINWGGNTYGTRFLLRCGDIDGYIKLYSQESMKKVLDHYIFNPTAGIHGIEKTEAVPNANGEVTGTARYFTDWSGGKKKDIVYSFSAGNTTYYVMEQYAIAYPEDTLYGIYVWGLHKTNNFYFSLLDAEGSVPKLTISEISQIGFED